MMVSFIRKVLVWMAALGVACALMFLMVFLLLAIVVGLMQPEPVSVRDGSILVLNLDVSIPDSPEADDPLAMLAGLLPGSSTTKHLPLLRLVTGLERAAEDPRIHGVLLRGNLVREGYGSSIAALQEVRAALEDVKAAGKPIWAYVDIDSASDYFLKSVADTIIMHPMGEVQFTGIGTDRFYFGEFLSNLGIEPLVMTRESYKTVAEPFARNEMSEPEREQVEAMISVIWQQYLSGIASARGVSPESVQRLSDEVGFLRAETLMEKGWVDSLAHVDELLDYFSSLVGTDPNIESFNQIAFVDYLDARRPPGVRERLSNNTVTVVYAEGIIVDGEGGMGQAGGDRIARLLREARRDDSVKAIVLRVNSPGGSATGSEKILREVERTNQEKPVIVSMGGIATSGGYWVSAKADTIFVSDSTITGSIGVALLFPVAEQLLENISIHTDRIGSGPLANTFSIARSKTEAEIALLDRLLDDIYDGFLTRVSEGRGMNVEQARNLAQGRVWMGAAAIENGLADRTGSLVQAIAFAADRAGIGDDYVIEEKPHRRTFQDIMADLLSPSALGRFGILQGRDPLSRELRAIEDQLRVLTQLNDPRGMHAIDLRFLRID